MSYQCWTCGRHHDTETSKDACCSEEKCSKETLVEYNIKHNGSKWNGEKPDGIEALFERLKKYTLNDTASISTMMPGVRQYDGNFVELSAAFSVEVELASSADKKLMAAFRANKCGVFQKA